MSRMSKIGFLAMLAAILFCLGMQPADAATVTKYFKFNAAQQLWNWTTTGTTLFGQPVTTGTVPTQQADPAKVAAVPSSPSNTHRSWQTDYDDLNTYKASTSNHLVSFNLAGLASGTTSVLQGWGESSSVNVTDIGGHYLFDKVGQEFPTMVDYPAEAEQFQLVAPSWLETGWFGQIIDSDDFGAEIPTWWCEENAVGLETDSAGFDSFFAYTFNDIAIQPDGRVYLWIGGIATNNLDGLPGSPHVQLEGLVKAYAYTDLDGDGHFPEKVTGENNPVDCNDDPALDEAHCSSCTCDQSICADCAYCMHPRAQEYANDTINTNCDALGQDNCFIATTSLGTQVKGKIGTVAAFALGLVAFGFVLGRKEKMKGLFVLLLAVGFLGLPLTVSADEDPASTTKMVFQASLQEGSSCGNVVEMLIKEGHPEAEVVTAALEGCKEGNETEILTSAIRAGADPFTVAYTAKNAGVDLAYVADSFKDIPDATVPDEPTIFEPPSPPVGASSIPVIITATSSSWGSSKWIASPSL